MKTKKAIAATGRFAASLLALFILFTAQADAQIFVRNLSFVNLAEQLKTPQDIAFYIWRNFQFEKDQRQFGREDYWQSPAEILQTQKGDCEDFALFASEILKLQGKNSFIINLYGGGKPHSICVFKEKGRYGAIDGKKVIPVDFETLDELLSYADPFWRKASLVEPTPAKNGRVLAEFSNMKKSSRRLGIFA